MHASEMIRLHGLFLGLPAGAVLFAPLWCALLVRAYLMSTKVVRMSNIVF